MGLCVRGWGDGVVMCVLWCYCRCYCYCYHANSLLLLLLPLPGPNHVRASSGDLHLQQHPHPQQQHPNQQQQQQQQLLPGAFRGSAAAPTLQQQQQQYGSSGPQGVRLVAVAAAPPPPGRPPFAAQLHRADGAACNGIGSAAHPSGSGSGSGPRATLPLFSNVHGSPPWPGGSHVGPGVAATAVGLGPGVAATVQGGLGPSVAATAQGGLGPGVAATAVGLGPGVAATAQGGLGGRGPACGLGGSSGCVGMELDCPSGHPAPGPSGGMVGSGGPRNVDLYMDADDDLDLDLDLDLDPNLFFSDQNQRRPPGIEGGSSRLAAHPCSLPAAAPARMQTAASAPTVSRQQAAMAPAPATAMAAPAPQLQNHNFTNQLPGAACPPCTWGGGPGDRAGTSAGTLQRQQPEVMAPTGPLYGQLHLQTLQSSSGELGGGALQPATAPATCYTFYCPCLS